MLSIVDAKNCPLCGNKNGCMAGTEEYCWCHTVIVPQALLELIPVDQRGNACICRSCINEFNDCPVRFIAKIGKKNLLG